MVSFNFDPVEKAEAKAVQQVTPPVSNCSATLQIVVASSIMTWRRTSLQLERRKGKSNVLLLQNKPQMLKIK